MSVPVIDFKIDEYVVACYPATVENFHYRTATTIYIKHESSFWVASKYKDNPIDWGDRFAEIPEHVKNYIKRYLRGIVLR